MELSDISGDKENVNRAPLIYNEALKNSGFNKALKFQPTMPKIRHRGRTLFD